ncbi:MAG: hypothetical protein O2877_03100, partial [bacterium]|nr:hypothetical protein [bacterium]
MKNRSFLYLSSFLFALVFAGAGCLGLGASEPGVDTSTDGGMWKSVDAGEIWQQSVSVPRANVIGSASGVNVLTIQTDPTDSNALYVGTESDGMLYSYDGGLTWRQSEDAVARSGAVTAISIDPSNKCRVYLSLGNRILRSDDCSRNFDQTLYVESKPGVIVTAMVVDWFNSENVYAALSDGTVLKSTNRGADWSSVFRGR